MISKKMAEQLNKVGLVWRPRMGDFYFYPDGQYMGEFLCETDLTYLHSSIRRVWLPSLIQLLDEIPKELEYKLGKDWIHIYNKGYKNCLFSVLGKNEDSIEDIIAKILLKIKGKEEEN